MKDALHRLIDRELPYILVGLDHFPERSILVPGSFNPLHAGHEGLLQAAEQTTRREGLFELSVTNVDKPPLRIVDVERRLLQLKGRYQVVLTCAPTFAEKAELFPGTWFAMGYDTAIRLLSPAYHADVPAMLKRFQLLETRFAVAGRLHEGAFQGLENIEIPAGFEELFLPIPESLFREDISSTELRNSDWLAEPTLQRCSVGSVSREVVARKIKDTPPRLERVFQKYDSPLYFVTFNTMHRRPLLARQEVHDAFIAYAEKNAQRGRAVGRYVIMPDHVHLFVRIGHGSRLNDFIRLLKQTLTQTLRATGENDDIWQPGFFDHRLRHSESYHEKWNYVRENPVRAGLVEKAEDWPWQGEVVWIDRV